MSKGNSDLFAFTFDGSAFAEHTGAMFSKDSAKTYRYALWRSWNAKLPYANFLLLNPSTADSENDDPTIVRLMQRARMVGFGGICVTNCYAFRATKPVVLKKFARAGGDPIGPENDACIVKWAKHAKAVIIGWGAHCEEIVPGRGAAVLALLKAIPVSIHAIGFNGDGSPVHPLYQPYANGIGDAV